MYRHNLSSLCVQMLARENTQRTFSGAMDALPQVTLLSEHRARDAGCCPCGSQSLLRSSLLVQGLGFRPKRQQQSSITTRSSSITRSAGSRVSESGILG